VKTRRSFLRSSISAAAAFAPSVWPARAGNAPGVTDNEIKIGQTMPYSGPFSSYSAIGTTEAAYFKMINEMGGVNGRKIKFISVDDGYSPSTTVEQVRRLVEQEQVAFIFNSVGTPTNAAIRSYLNHNKVPQLFVSSGASIFDDPQHFPWTIRFFSNFQGEARIYGKHILKSRSDAKIGVLYQNDSFGKDYLVGIKDGLGAEHSAMIVQEVSYEVSEPTVDSQIIALRGAGVDVLVIVASPKAAAQTIRKTFDIGWVPARYLCNSSSSIAGVLKPAGLEKSNGLITAYFLKDPNDPLWSDDAGMKEWSAFAGKYLATTDATNIAAAFAFSVAETLVYVLNQCGDDLSRENIMKQAVNIKDLQLPLLLPGIRVNTSPDNFNPIRQMRLAQFDGESWRLFGDLLSD
jgi:branched-chain amino acid transport system substrate-binding protein